MLRYTATETKNYFLNQEMKAMGGLVGQTTHAVYIKYANGWEKNLYFCTEEAIEETVAKCFEKGCYRVYVRELKDVARENEKVFTKRK